MRNIFSALFYTFIGFGLIFPFFVYAATGTIATNQYSRMCTNSDCSTYTRINWKPTNGTAVSITDTAITGYIWSEKFGWINLAPTNGGVTNSSGTLGGYAWGQGTGWINFNPTNGGVSIGTSGATQGQFSGYAWAQSAGWVKFDCAITDGCVSTDWTVSSTSTPGPTPTTPPVTPPTTPTTPPTTPTTPPTTPTTPPTTPTTPPTTPTTPPTTPTTPTTPPTGGTPPTGTPTTPPTTGVPPIIDPESPVGQIITSVGIAREEVRKIIETEEGEIATTAITSVGIVSGAAVSITSALFLNPLTFSELFLIPLRLWSLLLGALGLAKRRRPWGTVYDSVTKQPLDPAYVILRDEHGEEVATTITDLDGRYGFVVPKPGTYSLVAHKTNYAFPSQKLVGRDHDELYRDLYFGEHFVVTEAGEILYRNIPMDPEKFDWNEFAKKQQKLMKFYSERDKWLLRISDVLFYLGFLVAAIAVIVQPKTYNIIIFVLYGILFFVRRHGLRSRPYGYLKTTEGYPLSFAVIRISQKETGVEVMHRVADVAGRYYCLLPNGEYTLKVERKLPDGHYETVLENHAVEVTKGYLAENLSL